MKNLTQFIKESIWFFSNMKKIPSHLDLATIYKQTKGRVKNFDWQKYFDSNEYKKNEKLIDELFVNFFKAIDDIDVYKLGRIEEDDFQFSKKTRNKAKIAKKDCGFAISTDNNTWVICILNKSIERLPSQQQKALYEVISKYEDMDYQVEQFDEFDFDDDFDDDFDFDDFDDDFDNDLIDGIGKIGKWLR